MRLFLASTALLLPLALFDGTPATAGMARVAMGGSYRVPVVSYAERPFLTVIRQQFDYSCGSAALATLLRYHYGTPTNETEVFRAMYEAGDQERIQKIGFSLLDMKRYLAERGLRADGFRITLDNLAKVGVPAIALVDIDGYRHFVVIKGLRDGEVLVGDPAVGMRTFSYEAFEQVQVNDIVFVIRDRADLAKANFNKEQDWQLRRVAAPLEDGMTRHELVDYGVLAQFPVQIRRIEPRP